MAWKLHTIEQMQLQRQHRVDGVGRPELISTLSRTTPTNFIRDMLWCDGDCSGDAPERRANVCLPPGAETSRRELRRVEDADVGVRRDRAELGLDGLGHVQTGNEGRDRRRVDGLPRPRQLLQGLVGVRVRLPSQDRLDALGDDGPVVLEVVGDARRVELELTQTSQTRPDGQEGVAQRHAQRSQDRRVREVPLQPGNGQLRREV